MKFGLNTRLHLAFAMISIMIVVATALAIFRLEGLWKVINVTEKETFPETLAAMQLSQRSALLAAGAPVLAAGAGQALHDLVEQSGLQPGGAEIVHEEKRRRPP